MVREKSGKLEKVRERYNHHLAGARVAKIPYYHISASMKCRQPYWKCQGKVREFDLVWRVVTLHLLFTSAEDIICLSAFICIYTCLHLYVCLCEQDYSKSGITLMKFLRIRFWGDL